MTQWYRICLQCRRHGFDPWVGKIPWRRKWQPSLVYQPVLGDARIQRWIEGRPCPGRSHNLVVGGTENPMGRGAWRVTVHSVTKSQT